MNANNNVNATALENAKSRKSNINGAIFKDSTDWVVLPYDSFDSWVVDSRDNPEDEDARLYASIRVQRGSQQANLTISRLCRAVRTADGDELPLEGTFNAKAIEAFNASANDEEWAKTLSSQFAGKTIHCQRTRSYEAYVWDTGKSRKDKIIEFNL